MKEPSPADRGLFFDIQGFSLHDGPGTRTTFFFKGCPLGCRWCANPEGIIPAANLFFRRSRCRFGDGCRGCFSACPCGALSQNGAEIVLNRDLCGTCIRFDCAAACPYEALSISGKWLSLNDIRRVVERDRQYWGKNGGISLSGGEPLFQADFLMKVLRLCREIIVHSTIETSALAPREVFLEALDLADFAFVDLKLMDSAAHKAWTGVDNGQILENLAAGAARRGRGRLMIRIPLVSGVTDTPRNILSTIDFMKKCGLSEVNILPWHGMGSEKWAACGFPRPKTDFSTPKHHEIEAIHSRFERSGISCFVGHETPF